MDSLNFIKGYRYELWCLARSAATRYCVIHVDTPAETCGQWNAQRAGDAYSEEVMSDLLKRFERPDSKNRWDSPLFTIKPSQDEQMTVDTTIESVVSMILNKSGSNDDKNVILPLRHAKDLNPTLATTSSKLAGKVPAEISVLFNLIFKVESFVKKMTIKFSYLTMDFYMNFRHKFTS